MKPLVSKPNVRGTRLLAVGLPLSVPAVSLPRAGQRGSSRCLCPSCPLGCGPFSTFSRGESLLPVLGSFSGSLTLLWVLDEVGPGSSHSPIFPRNPSSLTFIVSDTESEGVSITGLLHEMGHFSLADFKGLEPLDCGLGLRFVCLESMCICFQ